MAWEKQQRWWLGPNELPLASLKLKCGPGLEFHEPEQDWTRRIEAIANEVRGGLVLPPLVAEYAAGKLLRADGNHRHGGLQLARTTHYCTAIWFNSKEDFGLYTSGR